MKLRSNTKQNMNKNYIFIFIFLITHFCMFSQSENDYAKRKQMNKNARQSAEIIVADAEVKAGKMLNKAHNRLAQLHEDITELKRQRLQLETQIRSIIENRHFTDLATNPVFSTRDYRAVPAKYRALIPAYIKDYVSLNQFVA